MTTRAEDYRRNAVECELVAKRSADPQVRRQFEQMARSWRELADHTELLGGSGQTRLEPPKEN
jgi:hypothetical protein